MCDEVRVRLGAVEAVTGLRVAPSVPSLVPARVQGRPLAAALSSAAGAGVVRRGAAAASEGVSVSAEPPPRRHVRGAAAV
eukprot:COSAG06_NODE_8310_length_2206_cov_2.239203_3_plen_80_part_00